jgi:CHAD domain-containing protein
MDEPRPAIVRSLARSLRYDEDTDHAARARPAPLTRRMAPDDAFRVTLLECLAQISANAGAVRTGRAVEALHQMRVGLRRLQVALAIFGANNVSLKALRGRAKALSSRLGPARDLDVFVGELLQPAADGAVNGEAFVQLRARAEAARDRAWDQVSDCVASADFAIFLDDVAAAAARSGLSPVQRKQSIKSLADTALDHHLARARKRARAAHSLEERDFHNLRIALKKLRYAGEFFAPLYKKRKVRAYLKRLKALQEMLGGLNDIAHVRMTLSALLEDEAPTRQAQGDLSFAAGQIQGWHRARAAKLGRKSLRRWKGFKRRKAFWG